MLDIGWQELMLVCVIAVIVVGPKELPKVVRGVVGFVRKARGLAHEFQSNLTEIADTNDIMQLKKDMEAVKDDIAKPLIATADDPTGLGSQLKSLQGEQQKIADEFNKAAGADFSGDAITKKPSTKPKKVKTTKRQKTKRQKTKTAIKPPSLKT